MSATGAVTVADFDLTWRAFPKADGTWAADPTGGARFVPSSETATVGKDL